MLLIFSFGSTFGQLKDDFSDGDILVNPAWSGDNSKFTVNGPEQLQLNSSGADTSYLSAANTALLNTEWNFWVKLSFAPSDNNYVKIYLVSDQQNLKGSVNGYFIRMGENGLFDSVDLWEQSGTNETKIIDGVNYHCGKSTNTLRVKVTCDNSGLWKVYSDTLGGTNYLLEGSTINTTFSATSYFGLSCKYSASNATKFYFDDIYAGPIIVDTIAPVLSSVFALNTAQLDVHFNEVLDKASAELPANYFVDGGIGVPVSAVKDNSNAALVHLTFANAFMTSQSYAITISGVKDANGNIENNLISSFVLPDHVSVNDVIINEVLPDPNAGGVDFIEVYNRSGKVLDFSEMNFVSFDTLTNQIKSSYQISGIRKLFYPNEYYVLCTDSVVLKNQYAANNPGGFIQMAAIPTMNIDAGSIGIVDISNSVIDRMNYFQNMHFSLLNNTKGISLERISFERSSDDKTNWHSASESSGGATPAFKNSQNAEEIYDKEVSVNPEIFSPDNDGHNDIVTIAYSFIDPGNIATINIYDSDGRLIRSLVQNQLLGVSGAFSWDGITDKLEKAPVGMYIVYFQVFDDKGKVKNFKKTTILASKLN